MKILQITPTFPPSIGGVETHLGNLVKGLHKLGHDIHVVTSKVPSARVPSIADRLKIFRLPVLFKLYEAPFCPSLPLVLSRMEPDIVHVHMPPRFFADCTSIFRKLGLLNAPLILSFHLYLENAPSFVRALSDFHYKTIGRFIFHTSNRIIVPTETYRNLVVKRFDIDPTKIDIIPYGIDLDTFNLKKFDKEIVKKKFDISDGKLILFVGRMDLQGSQQKGIKYLLEAMQFVLKEIDDVKLVIGGGGERLNYFRDLSINLGIAEKVKFIGEVPYSEIPSLFSVADVFVLPSLFESLGIVLCEAMAMEKPTVATRIRGIVDVVEEGKTGLLVEPQNSWELAKAIMKILSDEKLANQLGREGRKTVEKKYYWNFIVEQTIDTYEKASNRNNGNKKTGKR